MAIQWTPEELASMRRWDQMIDNSPCNLTEAETLSAQLRDIQAEKAKQARDIERRRAKDREKYWKNREKIKERARQRWAAKSQEEKAKDYQRRRERRAALLKGAISCGSK